MKFNKRLESEEEALIKLVNAHVDTMKKDRNMTFQDGLNVAYFIENAQLWYRYSLSIEAGLCLSRGQMQIHGICEGMQSMYKFNLSVESVQDATIYLNESEITMKEEADDM